MSNAVPAVPGSRVVVFDLDGTLCPNDTLWDLLRAVVTERPRRLVNVLLAAPGVMMRLRRDPDVAKQRLLAAALGRAPVAEAAAIARRAGERVRLSEEMLSLARRHAAAGDELWVASASVEPLVAAVAERVGATGYVATTLEALDGRLTGLFDGGNCKGEEKLKRLDARLPAGWRENAVAYSDASADTPLMQSVAQSHWVRKGRVAEDQRERTGR